ncbi:MAG TPA: hypothetical protein VKU02_03645 [Gemmataceae bacterium]|nr:hypothetical protein [Gemmataceae bacterium]
MPDISIEQALYGFQPGRGYRLLARSPGFLDEWLAPAEHLCVGFGERPPGVVCPASVFAQPFGKRQVTVVQVADQGVDRSGQPNGLAFRLLLLARSDYDRLGGDPFVIADRFPPPWTVRQELPGLSWPGDLPGRRTVEQIQNVLQRPEHGPNLLGGAQILTDGGRLVFESSRSDTELIRDLWTLLPTSARCELWPASFAFGNVLGFHALVVPDASSDPYAGYIRGEHAGDYPEGRYELNLQIAAESGDQAELDALFARRSLKETWRLGLLLLGMCIILAVLANVLIRPVAPRAKPPAPLKRNLPAAEHQKVTTD